MDHRGCRCAEATVFGEKRAERHREMMKKRKKRAVAPLEGSHWPHSIAALVSCGGGGEGQLWHVT